MKCIKFHSKNILFTLLKSIIMALFIRYKNLLGSKLSQANFVYANSHFNVCVSSTTFCTGIWLVYENLRDFTNLQSRKNTWVKVVENVEILVFATMVITNSIEIIKEKSSDYSNELQSIEKRLNTFREIISHGSVFPVFYSSLIFLNVLQIPSDSNYTRFSLIFICQFYLLNCLQQFVSTASKVKGNFRKLNKKLNTSLNKSMELEPYSLIDLTKELYEPLSSHDFSNIHWSICKYVKTVNNVYGLRLLAITVCIFYELMFTPYLLSLNLINVHSETSRGAITYACSLIFHLAELLLLTLSADSATRQADRTKLIFSEYLSNDLSEEEFHNIADILTNFEVHTAEFKIKNLFVLNRNFILKIFGAVTTYTIIFTQLQDAIKIDTIH